MFPLTPALSLKGEGAVCAGIILWGSLSSQGEGANTKNGNGCYRFASTMVLKTSATATAPGSITPSRFSLFTYDERPAPAFAIFAVASAPCCAACAAA